MFDLLFGSWVKRIAAIVIALALLGGGLQLRSWIHAKQELKAYKAAEKIRQQDKKTDQQTEERKDEIEKYNTPDDYQRGFDKLRDYRK